MSADSPFENGPFLSAAFFCEKILTEKDGVPSAIRIVDRVERSSSDPDAPEHMEPFTYALTLFISLKSGSARGDRQLKIAMVKPSGEYALPAFQTVHFEGEDDQGVAIVVEMKLGFDLEGLYWFELELNDVLLTRVPLRVIYTRGIKQLDASGV